MAFRHSSWLAGRTVQVFLLAVMVSGLSAQITERRPRVGVPEDWSHHRIKFNTAALHQHPEMAAREPRAAAQLYREAFERARAQMVASSSSLTPFADLTTAHRDWSVSLGSGRVQFGQFPAKWQSDPTLLPSCSTDFVVYALNVSGVTGGQPSLVGLNNLYSGGLSPLCPDAQPYFMFSYNTTTIPNGVIMTSPVLSFDGKKVAFVETSITPGTRNSVLHILKIPPPPPPNVKKFTATPSALPPAGAMINVPIAAASNARSSPWVDYATDTAYVALDNGILYKITGVFNGSHTLVTTAPWPITINLNSTFTSPVLDSTTGRVFLGAGNGRLYSVNVNTPGAVTSVAIGESGGANPAIYDSVLFDATGANVFAITSDDAVSTAAAVVQVNASSLAVVTRVNVGLGNTGGQTVNLYDGDFDNAYFNNVASGHMLVCGTGAADSTPHRYLLGFNAGGVLQPGSSVQLSANAQARCSPVTEFFNSNIAGGTDFFFWGVTRNCPGFSNNGCVMALSNGTSLTSAQVPGGTSGIIIDNNYVTKGGGSSIYFSSEANTLTAYKMTQQGLQ